MSQPADSFFNIFYTITFVVVFIGTLILTYIAPVNIWPGGLIYPKSVEVCLLTCEMVEVPINILWSGLINGATYGVLGTIGHMIIRLIKRKK
ncbi:unnamed protein product [marine sediment metagenome]|uniref:Uncharacterized protein n=1 Tax=marine sediment metagenome TaxID=412755 RepID=X0TCF6_9ZZZZ